MSLWLPPLEQQTTTRNRTSLMMRLLWTPSRFTPEVAHPSRNLPPTSQPSLQPILIAVKLPLPVLQRHPQIQVATAILMMFGLEVTVTSRPLLLLHQETPRVIHLQLT